MEDGNGAVDAPAAGWRFAPNGALASVSGVSIRAVLDMLMSKLDPAGRSPTVPLGNGDPSAFPCFRTTPVAEDAVVSALRSAKYNCYAPTVGISEARRSIAEHLSSDLPCKLSPDDIFLTSGCSQAIEVVISVLARVGANILLPRPGYPFYEARCGFSGLEVRHFDLLPERGWEVDLDGVNTLADENTVAIVIVNPGNPCGNVFTYKHLSEVAETARKLGIMVIADEVYGHLTFGSNPFVPMGVFGQIVPVLTLGSISKRWLVPGWRLGWIAKNDPADVLKQTKIVDGIDSFLNISTDPATFIQPIDEITTISERIEGIDPILQRVRALKIAPPLLTSPLQPSSESTLTDILVRKPSLSSSTTPPVSGTLDPNILLELFCMYREWQEEKAKKISQKQEEIENKIETADALAVKLLQRYNYSVSAMRTTAYSFSEVHPLQVEVGELKGRLTEVISNLDALCKRIDADGMETLKSSMEPFLVSSFSSAHPSQQNSIDL